MSKRKITNVLLVSVKVSEICCCCCSFFVWKERIYFDFLSLSSRWSSRSPCLFNRERMECCAFPSLLCNSASWFGSYILIPECNISEVISALKNPTWKPVFLCLSAIRELHLFCIANFVFNQIQTIPVASPRDKLLCCCTWLIGSF